MDVSKAVESHLVTGSSNKTEFSKLQGERLERGNWGITKNSKEYGFREKDYTHETDKVDRLGKLEPTTDIAKDYQGYGTTLKPALEPVVMARKPLIGTVAENVIQYGTGGINIDGCRIETNEDDIKKIERKPSINNQDNDVIKMNASKQKPQNENYKLGRFPANLIHDGSDEILGLFPNTTSGKMTPNHTRTTDGSPNGIYGKFDVNHPLSETYGDSGSAARFFYCAKTQANERNKGLIEREEKIHSDRTKNDGVGGDNPRNRTNKPRRNIHPTVKPLSLMKYLVKLVMPPKGGICLDPYLGSGTTAMACTELGVDWIGIEMEQEYADIANARINSYSVDIHGNKVYEIKQEYDPDELNQVDKEKGILNIFDFMED